MISWPADARLPEAGADLTRVELERRFHDVLDAHGAALGRLAASYARGSGERDDLLQDMAIAIWRALPQFRGECSERTFVFRIAHNRGLSHVARRRAPLAEVDAELAIADRAMDPEASLAHEQRGDRLRRAIQRLPVGSRQVVTLALEGLSYEDIGEVLGISASNVGARLTRARQMLRSLLNVD